MVSQSIHTCTMYKSSIYISGPERVRVVWLAVRRGGSFFLYKKLAEIGIGKYVGQQEEAIETIRQSAVKSIEVVRCSQWEISEFFADMLSLQCRSAYFKNVHYVVVTK